jgi:hypothetical protein
VTDKQLYLMIGAPMLVNTVLFTLLAAYIRAKFKALDRRFDDMRDPGGPRWTAPGRSSTPGLKNP